MPGKSPTARMHGNRHEVAFSAGAEDKVSILSYFILG
jgi:hypothetical protein